MSHMKKIFSLSLMTIAMLGATSMVSAQATVISGDTSVTTSNTGTTGEVMVKSDGVGFAACVAAGNPIMESYPPKCRDKQGITYTKPVGVAVPALRAEVPGVRAEMQAARAEMEMRARALRASSTMMMKDMRASTTSTIKDMRGEFKDMSAGMRMDMETRAKAMRASTTKAYQMMKEGEGKKHFEYAQKKTHAVVGRLEAAIARVQKLSDRVSERLTKLEAEGVATTASRAHLVEAKAKLSLAAAQTANIKLSIETVLASVTRTASTTVKSDTKDAFKNIHELVKETTKTIKEAHSHVALAISSVKPGQNKPSKSATTTAATSTSTTTSTSTQ